MVWHQCSILKQRTMWFYFSKKYFPSEWWMGRHSFQFSERRGWYFFCCSTNIQSKSIIENKCGVLHVLDRDCSEHNRAQTFRRGKLLEGKKYKTISRIDEKQHLVVMLSFTAAAATCSQSHRFFFLFKEEKKSNWRFNQLQDYGVLWPQRPHLSQSADLLLAGQWAHQTGVWVVSHCQCSE